MAQKIKSLTFKKNGNTLIKFFKSEQPRGYNDVVTHKSQDDCDQIRHKDFQFALEKIAPHILIRTEFATIIDRIDRPMDMEWFQQGHWEDDSRFEGLEITGVIIQGKDAVDGIQLLGRKVMEDGASMDLKTPPIRLYNEPDGYNYPLMDILSSQVETLLTEAENYLNGKTGATKQMEIQFEDRKLAAV